ncbi:MAG: HEAT repeat domain-containing protein [Steroidobacteraceae bacterium]
MGALASQRVMELMARHGLQPIELERYSSSNKIWTTKVKRLRLPDLLCAKTGLRVEVRAKSDLAIRMSDAPENEARRWFSGLFDDDIIAFVQCRSGVGAPIPADTAELFRVKHLRKIPEIDTRLGPPKSAGEGSERDRTWASIVPKRSGEVLEVTAERILTKLDGGRRQSYRLRGMTPYVRRGSRFSAEREFIAGLPQQKVSFAELGTQFWDPRSLADGSPLDQYITAKALGTVGLKSDHALLRALYQCEDARVSLEAAGSLAKLGSSAGLDWLEREIANPRDGYLRMEAVFLLSEMRGSPVQQQAAKLLAEIGGRAVLVGDESRQAAIWGLGRAGLHAYSELLPFLDADDEDERIHATVAFGPELPGEVVSKLVSIVGNDSGSDRQRASALHILSRLNDVDSTARQLCEVATGSTKLASAWARAALGSMEPHKVRNVIRDQALLEDILPLQLLSTATNWTRNESTAESINFVQKQTVFSD